MKIKSYLPYLTIPCGIGWFTAKFFQYMNGTLNIPRDSAAGVWLFAFGLLVWSIFALWCIVSGIVALQHSYIVTDSYSIKVFGNSLNKRVSDEILWSDIDSFRDRTFHAIVLQMKNGQVKKIQLNGMGPWTIARFIKQIKSETENANQAAQATAPDVADPGR